MSKLNVSFKNTTKDMKLLSYISVQEEKSQFIKDCIEFYLDYLENGCKNHKNNPIPWIHEIRLIALVRLHTPTCYAFTTAYA